MRQKFNEVILLLIVVWKIDEDHSRTFDLPQFQGQIGLTFFDIRFRDCIGIHSLNTIRHYNKMKVYFGLVRESKNMNLICEPVM